MNTRTSSSSSRPRRGPRHRAAARRPGAPAGRPQAPIFGTGIEIINLSLSVTDAREQLRDRPRPARLRGLRGRDPAGAEPLHPREPADLHGADDRHVGVDGGEAPDGAGGGHPVHEDAAAAGPRPGRAVQRPGDDAPALHERPRRARGGDQEDGGLGPDRAPQRPLHRPQGPDARQEGGGAAAAGDRPALGRRGHRLARRPTTRSSSSRRRARSTSTRSACARAGRATGSGRRSARPSTSSTRSPARRAGGRTSRPRSASSTRSTTGSPRSCARSTASATSRRTPAATASGAASSCACPTARASPSATSSATTRRAPDLSRPAPRVDRARTRTRCRRRPAAGRSRGGGGGG